MNKEQERELAVYKQINESDWKGLAIGAYYHVPKSGMLVKVLGKPESECVEADITIFNNYKQTYIPTHRTSSMKDYNFGAYRELTEEEYNSDIQRLETCYTINE